MGRFWGKRSYNSQSQLQGTDRYSLIEHSHTLIILSNKALTQSILSNSKCGVPLPQNIPGSAPELSLIKSSNRFCASRICILNRNPVERSVWIYTIDVVATCVVLHNICEWNGDRCDPEWIHQESQIDDTVNPPVVGTSTASGANIRNAIKQYVFQHQ